MTSEQKVKQVYHDAYLASGYSTEGYPDTYQVYRLSVNGSFGDVRRTPGSAWMSAWKKIMDRKKAQGKENQAAAKAWSV